MGVRLKWWMGAVALGVLAWPAAGHLYAELVYAGPAARLMRSSRKEKHPKAKPVAVSSAQMDLARQMVRTAYTLGTGLEIRQRVALTTRLLYTMRPQAMAVEKREWAEEVFGLAQQLPLDGAGAAGAGGHAATTAAPAAGSGGYGDGYAAKDAAPAAGAEAIAIAAARLAL